MGAKVKIQQKNEARGPVVFIVGDERLVAEYAEICASKGYATVTGSSGPRSTKQSRLSIPAAATVAIELSNIDLDKKREHLRQLDEALSPDRVILSTSITVTATEQASWITNRHRLVGIGALPGSGGTGLLEIAPTLHTPKETIEVAHRFLGSIGKEIEIVQDRVGMVLPRVLCQIINEATFALAEEVASPQDIDLAVTLGLNYPRGPIAWADAIGFDQVRAVLQALQKDTGEERYRSSPLLNQMVHGGQWWK